MRSMPIKIVSTIITVFVLTLPIKTVANLDELRNRDENSLKQQSDKAWETLQLAAFQDRKINEDQTDAVIKINAPYRSENPAIVPVSIQSKIPQTESYYIKKHHVYLDKNPLPLVGIFEFTPDSGKADLAMRIRVDNNTYFRVVTEMNNGDLFMSKSFIRSLGGCSEPLGASVDESRKHMGEMKIATVGNVVPSQASLIQLKIRHPNITGLGASQRTGVKPPPHFIKTLKINYANKVVMQAQLTFAISQDPSFRFFLMPKEALHEIVVTAVDTKNNEFESKYAITFTGS